MRQENQAVYRSGRGIFWWLDR
jgi:hypothetical protein